MTERSRLRQCFAVLGAVVFLLLTALLLAVVLYFCLLIVAYHFEFVEAINLLNPAYDNPEDMDLAIPYKYVQVGRPFTVLWFNFWVVLVIHYTISPRLSQEVVECQKNKIGLPLKYIYLFMVVIVSLKDVKLN